MKNKTNIIIGLVFWIVTFILLIACLCIYIVNDNKMILVLFISEKESFLYSKLLMVLVILSFITMSVATIVSKLKTIKEDNEEVEYVQKEKEVMDLANMGSRYIIRSRDERRLISGIPSTVSYVIYVFLSGIVIFLSNAVYPWFGFVYCLFGIVFNIVHLVKRRN